MKPGTFIVTVGAVPVPYEILKFNGGEIQVRISDTSNLWRTRDFPVEIFANLTDSDTIMELVNLVDAFRRIEPTIRLRLVAPYFPYARQDRVCVPGESLAVSAMASIINLLNFERVEVWDAHSDVTPAVVRNTVNVPAAAFLDSVLLGHEDEYVLIAPDAGAGKERVPSAAHKYRLPMFTAEKHRDPYTGQILSVSIKIDPKVVGKRKFLMLDDLCDGGMSFIKLAEQLKLVRHENNEIELYVTHGIFSKGVAVLHDAGISRVYSANVFPNVDLSNPYLTLVKKG